jgi:hypothetical protein
MRVFAASRDLTKKQMCNGLLATLVGAGDDSRALRAGSHVVTIGGSSAHLTMSLGGDAILVLAENNKNQ